jgi:hypothetical protein
MGLNLHAPTVLWLDHTRGPIHPRRTTEDRQTYHTRN